MFRSRGARLRLTFDEDDGDDRGSQATTPIGNSTETGHYVNPATNSWTSAEVSASASSERYWDDVPPSPRKVPGSSLRKTPASPRRAVPYASRKPKGSRGSAAAAPPPLHLTAHDSILGSPLRDSHGPVYPMVCCATLQPCSEGQRYVLTTVLLREDSDIEPSLPGRKVANHPVAKNMRAGEETLCLF